jgi:ribonuclease P protein component
MLQRANRLGSEKDIARLFSKGKFASSRFLTAKAVPNGTQDSRYAFVVGVKVSKRAVERNKVRRRMREIVRLHIGRIKPGFDIAFIAKKEALSATYKEIEQDMATAVDRIGLLQR